MAEDKHSFQSVLKLISAMQTFETLLGSSSITPDACVRLGINEQFKALHDTLAQYVNHEDTTIENCSCVCTLCNNEVKIFDFDLKTSLDIHNRSELHKIMKKMNQQTEGFGVGLEKKSPRESVDLNNIPKELEKISLSDVLSLTDKGVGFKQNNLADNSLKKTCSCERAFCICDLSDKKPISFDGKMSNLNMDQKVVNLKTYHAQLPLGLPGQPNMPPPLFPVSELNEKRTINSLQSPAPLLQSQNPRRTTNKPNRKETRRNKVVENPSVSNSLSGIPAYQPEVNIHVHMPQQTSDTNVLADKPKPQAVNETQNQTLFTEENFQKLRSRELHHRAEFHLIFRMVREVEGYYWSKGNFTKNGHEFTCNVCSLLMISSLDFIDHIRGRQHMETLKHKSSINVYQPQPQICYQTQAAPKSAIQYKTHAVSQCDDERKQTAQMWRNVKQAEGDLWSRHHITKHASNDFECHLCGVILNSPFQLLQHVKGSSHQSALENENENGSDDDRRKDCVVM